jgi:hypothetical protein
MWCKSLEDCLMGFQRGGVDLIESETNRIIAVQAN